MNNSTSFENLTHEEFAKDATVTFGFWMYLMSDFVLFAGLFAVFAVLHTNVFGGPSMSEIFNGHYVLIETMVLLTSSFTCGLSLLAAHNDNVKQTLYWLCASALLGATFLIMELSEFARLVLSGAGPQASGFLSAYFTLVGTHGLHITVGLLWVVALIVAISRKGLNRSNLRKLVLWSLFWHFLDIIWIFIFTIVYLFGIV
jgi:cytochrome o ubiquinol oxidase subunit III